MREDAGGCSAFSAAGLPHGSSLRSAFWPRLAQPRPSRRARGGPCVPRREVAPSQSLARHASLQNPAGHGAKNARHCRGPATARSRSLARVRIRNQSTEGRCPAGPAPVRASLAPRQGPPRLCGRPGQREGRPARGPWNPAHSSPFSGVSPSSFMTLVMKSGFTFTANRVAGTEGSGTPRPPAGGARYRRDPAAPVALAGIRCRPRSGFGALRWGCGGVSWLSQFTRP